ncbi:MAG TPA: hypothetical protein VFX15_00620 [Actinomycetes bacterium]|nr:hypothetical protein [Actinomycetes bacterium]
MPTVAVPPQVPRVLRLTRTILLVVALALVLSACVTPALNAADYRDKALGSAEAATSEVGTAKLVCGLLLRERVLQSTADETLGASEDALGSISDSLLAVQPPRGADPIYLRLATQLDRAESAVRDARIAARRSDTDALVDLVGRMDTILADLAATEELLA